jgi:hypothetical protein
MSTNTTSNTTAPKNRILAAVTSAPRENNSTCPRTGIELVARLPSRTERRDASAAASEQWGDRRLTLTSDYLEQINVQREHLLARCILCDGQPIGLETISALDEATLDVYDQALSQLEHAANPESDTWTREDLDEVIDGLKKKEAATEERLKGFDGATLLPLLRTMADRLDSVPTPKSSSDTCG